MAYNTKINLNNDKVCQNSGDLLTLSGNTVIAASGSLNYAEQPTWSGDTQIATKKYVDDNSASATTYNLGSPAAVCVGGIDVNYVLTGKTTNCIIQDMLYPELLGDLSIACMASVTVFPGASPVEVGVVTDIDVNATFCRGSINPAYWTTGSYSISSIDRSGEPISYSFTGPQLGAGFVACTSDFASCTVTSHVVVEGNNTWGACTCYSEGLQPMSNKNNSYDIPYGPGVVAGKTDTIVGTYPYFYGVCDSGSEPVANQSLIDSGDKCVALSDSNLSVQITYGEQVDKWLWFALPSCSSIKQGWYESLSNNANIGSPSDMFGAPTLVTVDSPELVPLWAGQDYNIYITNYATDATPNPYCMTNDPQQQ